MKYATLFGIKHCIYYQYVMKGTNQSTWQSTTSLLFIYVRFVSESFIAVACHQRREDAWIYKSAMLNWQILWKNGASKTMQNGTRLHTNEYHKALR